MSNPQRASLTKSFLQPSTQGAEKRHTDTTCLEEAVVYKCTCGTPDTSENWICCDDDDCPVGWYHWECVRVTGKPSGEWLCPRCSLKPMNHARSIQAKMSMSFKPGNTDSKDIRKPSDHHDKEEVKDKKSRGAKKGIAIKKSTPKKKAQWVGWIETDSDGDAESKRDEDAAQEPGVVAEGRHAKPRANNSKSRMTRSKASTSNIAARVEEGDGRVGKGELSDMIGGIPGKSAASRVRACVTV